ncbi:36482_t:CDS:2, partial [Racocetra persica]
LRLSPTKYHFAKRELKFLGYVVSLDVMRISGPGILLSKETAFQALKEKLTTAPVLAYPNFSQEFLLFTDALGIALGAILSQRDLQGRESVIFYASRSMSFTEHNYSVTEQECLAVEYTFTIVHHAGKSHSNADSLSRIAESSTTTSADF